MKERIEIFCPVCEELRHKKKKLLEVAPDAEGTIYPFCKLCHNNVKIKLVPKSRSEND